jgi:hypothetical protein
MTSLRDSSRTWCNNRAYPGPSPEGQYERTWALAVLDRVLQRLRTEYVAAGREHPFEAMQPFLAAVGRRHGYAQLGDQLGMAESTGGVTIHRMRRRYGDLLRGKSPPWWPARNRLPGPHGATPGSARAPAGNHQIRIHDPATGVLLAPPMTELEHVPFVAFSQDGRFLTSACSDTAVRIIDGTNGTPLLLNRAHTIRVWKAVLSPDNTRLASSGDESAVHVLNVASRQPEFPPLKHQDAVTHVAFSPDGRKLVSTSVDTTARVWDSTTGQPLVAPLRHRGTVWEACFSPDGQRVLTASADRSAQVWDALTGESAAPPIRSDQGLQGA